MEIVNEPFGAANPFEVVHVLKNQSISDGFQYEIRHDPRTSSFTVVKSGGIAGIRRIYRPKTGATNKPLLK